MPTLRLLPKRGHFGMAFGVEECLTSVEGFGIMKMIMQEKWIIREIHF